jgi:hypothetical protein
VAVGRQNLRADNCDFLGAILFPVGVLEVHAALCESRGWLESLRRARGGGGRGRCRARRIAKPGAPSPLSTDRQSCQTLLGWQTWSPHSPRYTFRPGFLGTSYLPQSRPPSHLHGTCLVRRGNARVGIYV